MTWDKTKPEGTKKLRESDDIIRNHWDHIEEALSEDHQFPDTYGTDLGEHLKISFNAPISSPTAAANKGYLYTKDVSDKAELHFLDEDDNEIQLTSGGLLTAVYADIPSGTIILVESDTAITGYTLLTDVDDVVPFITKGSVAGGETGGSAHSTGTWTVPTAHTHDYSGETDQDTVSQKDQGSGTNNVTGRHTHTYNGTTDSGLPDITAWRPAARNMTRQQRT